MKLGHIVYIDSMDHDSANHLSDLELFKQEEIESKVIEGMGVTQAMLDIISPLKQEIIFLSNDRKWQKIVLQSRASNDWVMGG